MRPRGFFASSLLWVASLGSASAGSAGNAQLETTLPMDAATFARLARSAEFYTKTRAAGDLSKQEVVELGDWVTWEFQSEDHEAPSDSENSDEVVPNPPPFKAGAALSCMTGGGIGGVKGMSAAAVTGKKEQRRESGAVEQSGQGMAEVQAQQMYRKVRLRYAVSSPMGSSHSDGAQGHTLREGEDEVIYTETDCISGLPMFKGDLVVKTTYRVTRDESDPDNSVRVKVTVVVRDVKLPRAVGWLNKGIKRVIKDSGKKQAVSTLQQMVNAKSTPGLRHERQEAARAHAGTCGVAKADVIAGVETEAVEQRAANRHEEASHRTFRNQACFEAARALSVRGAGVQVRRNKCFAKASQALWPGAAAINEHIAAGFSSDNVVPFSDAQEGESEGGADEDG
eukprot:g10396.t1